MRNVSTRFGSQMLDPSTIRVRSCWSGDRSDEY
jgi:hypothetical protein